MQAVEKQRREDDKISDLVDQINDVLNFVQHSQEIRLDKSYLERVVVQLLDQTAECAIFICQYFQNSFICMQHISLLLHLNVYGSIATVGRLARHLVDDPLAKIEEFKNSLTHILERLQSHMQIQDLIISSNIQKDISQLGRLSESSQ